MTDVSDSVPAPMVQLPAETVEALREAFDNHGDDPCPVYEAARAVVDAATPAASVPAADILALAEKWAREPYPTDDTEQPDLIQRTRAATCGNHAADLRALVAAAEQADKGEAADTPRDGCPKCGHARHDSLGWCPNIASDNDDCSCQWGYPYPAAPPEPLCRCRHAKSEHAQESFSCGHVIEGSGCELHVCSCSVFRYGSPAPVGEPPCTCGLDRDPIPGARHVDACPKRPARVPANDEAEAERAEAIALVEKVVTNAFINGGYDWDEHVSAAIVDALAGFRAARQGGNSDD